MTQLVATYLQDHHAGSVGGLQAFQRVTDQHSDPHVREVVATVLTQVEQDQAALEELIVRVGGTTSTLKDAAAWAGEKMARLKPNERVVSRSPLSDVVELETLILGVHGKLLLWQALIEIADPRLDQARLRDLADRAQDQEATLAALRLSQTPKLLQG